MVKLLVMDVDGTLTDGKIYMGNRGEVFKVFDIKDGCGICNILPKHNITPMILTARNSKIVENRCKELGVEMCFQGIRNKKDFLLNYIRNNGLNKGNVAYIGDDLIDIESMMCCGLKGCPNDAAKEVKEICEFISEYNGGKGAVRDFIEWIVKYNCCDIRNKKYSDE